MARGLRGDGLLISDELLELREVGRKREREITLKCTYKLRRKEDIKCWLLFIHYCK